MASAAIRRSSSAPRRPVLEGPVPPRSVLFCGKPDAKADEHAAGEGVERPADARPVKQVPRPGDDQAVSAQPAEGEQTEQEPEAEDPSQAVPAGELWQQADEKAGHLGVAQVIGQSLTDGADPA